MSGINSSKSKSLRLKVNLTKVIAFYYLDRIIFIHFINHRTSVTEALLERWNVSLVVFPKKPLESAIKALYLKQGWFRLKVWKSLCGALSLEQNSHSGVFFRTHPVTARPLRTPLSRQANNFKILTFWLSSWLLVIRNEFDIGSRFSLKSVFSMNLMPEWIKQEQF